MKFPRSCERLPPHSKNKSHIRRSRRSLPRPLGLPANLLISTIMGACSSHSAVSASSNSRRRAASSDRRSCRRWRTWAARVPPTSPAIATRKIYPVSSRQLRNSRKVRRIRRFLRRKMERKKRLIRRKNRASMIRYFSTTSSSRKRRSRSGKRCIEPCLTSSRRTAARHCGSRISVDATRS